MTSNCSTPTGCKYSTSESFALVHRPASSNTQGDVHNADGQERQPQKHRPDFIYLTLRNRLGLGSWKCGRCTTAGTPCPNGILLKTRGQIASLITSMVCLSQEAPELISKLERLAQIVHCGSHRQGDKAKWMAAFPAHKSGIQCLEEHITEVFGSASTNCGAAIMKSSPCDKKVGGRKVQNFQRTINEIMRLRLYQSNSQIDYYLCILEKNIYCSDHEFTKPLQKQNAWKSRILEIRTMADSKLGMSARCELPNDTGCKTGPLDTKNQQLSRLKVSPTPDIEESRAFSWPEEFDISPFHLIPRKSRRKVATLNDYIQNKIDRILSQRHRIPGYVYVFEAENIQGYFKIGYTTSPVIERLQSLSFGCNRQFNVLFPSPAEFAEMVPNARRVEELCQSELVDCQVYIDCTGCLCEHEEWFQISATEAISTVQKWSAWMNSTPYDPALGTLKKKESRGVSNMHEFKNELPGVATYETVAIEGIS